MRGGGERGWVGRGGGIRGAENYARGRIRRGGEEAADDAGFGARGGARSGKRRDIGANGGGVWMGIRRAVTGDV